MTKSFVLNTIFKATMLSALVLSTVPSYASSHNHAIDKMQKQIEILQKELTTLKEKSIQQEEKIVENHQSVIKAESNGIKVETNTKDVYGHGFEVAMSPSPRIKVGELSWQPFGELAMETAFFSDDKFDHPDASQLRFARLGMRGSIASDFNYVVDVNFANNNVGIINAFMDYKLGDLGVIRVGHNRSPYSLEGMTNNNYWTFAEVAPSTAAFDVGEILGAAVHLAGDNWVLGAGLYNQNVGLQDNDDEGWRVASRFAVAPIKENENILHLGVSAAHIEARDTNNTLTFGANAGNTIQRTNLVRANMTNADSHDLFGFEAATVQGPLSLQGEYFYTNVQNRDATPDSKFHGGYIQASYFLTGESRPYVDGNATFGRIVPKNSFLGGKGAGAWEVALRYDTLDLNDGTVQGGEMDTYSLGVNWYQNQYARMTFNYIMTDTDENAFSAAHDSPSMLLLRQQVFF